MSLPAKDYRDRLYQSYLSSQLGLTLEDARRALKAPQPYLDNIAKLHISPDKKIRILDIGCGIGTFINNLKSKGYTNLLGVETSSQQVSVAHQVGLDCIHQGNLVSFLSDLGTESHDVVIAFDVLEHFTKDELVALLDDIHRILKPKGMLIAHVPNGEAIFSGKVFFGDLTHQTAFTRRSISQLAATCGFGQTECYEDGPVIHGPMSAVRALLWKCWRSIYWAMNAAETGDYKSGLILSQNLLAVCRKS